MGPKAALDEIASGVHKGHDPQIVEHLDRSHARLNREQCRCLRPSISPSMREFVYNQPTMRVVFGARSLDSLVEETERLGVKRALVISIPEQTTDAENIARRLGGLAAGTFNNAVMHVPVETAAAALKLTAQLFLNTRRLLQVILSFNHRVIQPRCSPNSTGDISVTGH